MRNDFLRKIFVIVLIIFVLTMFWYGSYLPYKKSSEFLKEKNLIFKNQYFDLKIFINNLDSILNMRSPIGNQEILKKIGLIFLNILRDPNFPKEAVPMLIEFIKKHYEPIIQMSRGVYYENDLIIYSLINKMGYFILNDEKYLKESRNYLEIAYNLFPRKPDVLYNLLDVCYVQKDIVCIDELTEKILFYWPEDNEIKRVYDEFLNQNSTSSKK